MSETEVEEDVLEQPARGGVAKFAIGLLLLIGVVAGWWFYAAGQQTKVELDIHKKLNEFGAEKGEVVSQLDVGRKFVSTLMVRTKIEEVMPMVSQLRSLNSLDVAQTAFGDQHVDAVKNNGKLLTLVLSDTQVTDTGVAELSSMSLKDFYVARTNITGNAFDSIARMPALEIVDISGTSTANAFSKLKDAKSLVWIRMEDVDVSSVESEVLETLLGLPELGRLTFNDATGLTKMSLDKLKAERPKMMLEKVGGE